MDAVDRRAVIEAVRTASCTRYEFDRMNDVINALPSLESVDALELLAAHENWELDYGQLDPLDEEGEYGWRVHSVNGGVNDREWTLLGTGETPIAAILAALSAFDKE